MTNQGTEPTATPNAPSEVNGRELGVIVATALATDFSLRRLPGANVAGTVLFTTAALGLVFTGRPTQSSPRSSTEYRSTLSTLSAMALYSSSAPLP